MVLVAVRDLLFRSKIEAAAARVGVPLALAPRGTSLDAVVDPAAHRAVLLDLSQDGAVDALRAVRARAPELPVIGFLGHLEVARRDEALAAGASEVLTRGALSARLDEVLRRASADAPSSSL